jgi:hypothetical protein
VKYTKEPLFYSFHTPDEKYTKLANNLTRQLLKLGLCHWTEVVEHQGTWFDTVRTKPSLILKQMKAVKRDIIYIDVDCEILKYPKEVIECDAQLAARKWGNAGVWDGFILFRYSPNIIHFLEHWASETARNTGAVEGEVFAWILAGTWPFDIHYLSRDYSYRPDEWNKEGLVLRHLLMGTMKRYGNDVDYGERL